MIRITCAGSLAIALACASLPAAAQVQAQHDAIGDALQYIVPLGAGFGLQVALYVRLRQLLLGSRDARNVMAASGTTSTAAMISCCAHYLVNNAPVLGATGLVTFAAQYQVQFFWVGIAFNLAGIAYIGNKLWNATKEHLKCKHA